MMLTDRIDCARWTRADERPAALLSRSWRTYLDPGHPPDAPAMSEILSIGKAFTTMPVGAEGARIR
ncbi:hypothetical protein [Nocardia altamirensis]|uniref:hypothetical protein n=1 Tax=Nocardia altamirensis TaxID=472158 RepID=UPI00084052EA|nr:hypothetical protein [Nocardia altamirensis]